MEKINYFNYCAVIIIFILFISIFFRRLIHGKSNRYFTAITMIILLSSVFDTMAIGFDNAGSGNVFWKNFSHMGYLLFHNLTAAAYVLYFVSLTDTWHKFKNTVMRVMFYLPISIVTAAIVTNPFTHLIFSLDENDIYTRGILFPILYVSSFFYLAIGLIHLIKFHNLFQTSKFISLIMMYPIIILAILIQMLYPQYPVEMFANAIALLFVSMMIQRPEDEIDSLTGVKNMNAYAVDRKCSFANEKKLDIILINIANYQSLYEIIGFDGVNHILKKIASNLMKINKQLKAKADLYYLDTGRFRMVIDRRYESITQKTADIINRSMKYQFSYNNMNLNLITYICVAHCPEDIDDFSMLMSFGNDFHKKHDYTGDIFYASDIFEKKHYSIIRNLDSIIDNAIANDKLSVYYQPIYSINEKRFNSAEALIRLNDDVYGFISPELFIPAAEKSGAIHKIGNFVLESVCSFIASDDFRKLGLDYIEVNLSVVQCMNNNLANDILSIIKKHGISSEQLNLEITETAAANFQNIISENLKTLSDAGISFSLDDFGTGYSNIRRVASLPLKIVKLDKTFVNNENNPKMMIVLKNTIKMLKALNMKIVVEGIETKKCMETFAALECEYIQGYYYSKPLPKKHFIEFIDGNNT
ncbi:MAG TPA: EAL domain-containing protein [Ruminococcus sp.]|nr:EAL domain-containing protein [Ruminococcus sp.]